MSPTQRAKLTAALKLALSAAADADAGIRPQPQTLNSIAIPPALAPASAGGSISFTLPLLREVLAGRKTQTRRPIRPAPASVRAGVPLTAEGVAIDPIFETGQRVAIREKWGRGPDGRFVYAIDDEDLAGVRWQASRFMPAAAARRFLKIIAVRASRLSSTDDAAAIAEGVGSDPAALLNPRDWFLALWDAIYGDTEFAAANNPWVWVVEFEQAP